MHGGGDEFVDEIALLPWPDPGGSPSWRPITRPYRPLVRRCCPSWWSTGFDTVWGMKRLRNPLTWQ